MLVFGALTEFLGYWLGSHRINNYPIFNLYTIVEFFLLTGIYYLSFTDRFTRRLLQILGLVFLLFALADLWLIEGLFKLNSYTLALEALILMPLSLLFFIRINRELRVPVLTRYPMFWINSGVLIYFSGNLFLFIFSNALLTYGLNLYESWIIHSMLNTVSHLIYTVALWNSRYR